MNCILSVTVHLNLGEVVPRIIIILSLGNFILLYVKSFDTTLQRQISDFTGRLDLTHGPPCSHLQLLLDPLVLLGFSDARLFTAQV